MYSATNWIAFRAIGMQRTSYGEFVTFGTAEGDYQSTTIASQMDSYHRGIKMSSRTMAPVAGRTISREIAIFFVAVGVVISAMVALATTTGNEIFAIIGVVLLGPSVTAMVLTALAKGRRGLRRLLINQINFRFSVRWYLAAFLVIPAVALIALGIRSLFGGPDLAPDTDYSPSSVFPEIVSILIITLVISLGEELGFRGYALPRLQVRLNALQASLVLGVLWGFWHFPGHLAGMGTPQDMPFYVFMLWVIPATILITWVYNNSGSVVTAILMHTAANISFNAIPLIPEMTGTGELTTFWVFLGVVWTATIAVVIVFGPTHLSRTRSRKTTGHSEEILTTRTYKPVRVVAA